MPWAWGLAWCCLSPTGALRTIAPFLLSLVLVLQVLPGHFQLAFMTQFGILLIVVWVAIEHWVRRVRERAIDIARSRLLRACAGQVVSCSRWPRVFPAGGDPALADGAAGGAGSLAARFRLLVRLCVDSVSPGQLRRAGLVPSLDRSGGPLVWDPFHTSPEEHLAYIGLVPSFLACMAMFREWRRDRAVRLLTILFIVTLVLSLGSLCRRGFAQLIMLPGFSFFRAPSRWSLAVGSGTGIIGGQGIRSAGWNGRSPGRSLRRFSLVAVVLGAGRSWA